MKQPPQLATVQKLANSRLPENYNVICISFCAHTGKFHSLIFSLFSSVLHMKK